MMNHQRRSELPHSSSSDSSPSSSEKEDEERKNAPTSHSFSQKRVNAKPRPPLFTVLPNYVPRIPDSLDPTVPLSPLGPAINVTDGCVIIQSKPDVPSLDAGTSLFLDGGKPLGEIYETFGPVSTPFYVVVLPNSPCLSIVDSTSQARAANRSRRRYPFPGMHNGDVFDTIATSETGDSSALVVTDVDVAQEPFPDADHVDKEEEEDKEEQGTKSPACSMEYMDGNVACEPDTSVSMQTCDSNIAQPVSSEDKPVPEAPSVQVGDMVYFVRNDPDLTIPVFYNHLVQMKGSDASWVNDTEPPPEELEFSDDEQERLHKRNLRTKRRNPASVNNTKISHDNGSRPALSTSSGRQSTAFKPKVLPANHTPLTSAMPISSTYSPVWASHNEPTKPVPFCSTVPPPASIPVCAQSRPQQPAYNLGCSRPPPPSQPPFSSPIPSLPSSAAWPPQAAYGCSTDWPQPTWCPSMTTSSSPAFSQVTSGHSSWNSTFAARSPCTTNNLSVHRTAAPALNSTSSPQSNQHTSPGIFFGFPGTQVRGACIPQQRPPPPPVGGPSPCTIMNTGCPIGRSGPLAPVSTQSTSPLVTWPPVSASASLSGSSVPNNPLFTRYPPPAVRMQQPVMLPPHTVSTPVTFTAPPCSLMVPPPPGSMTTSVYSFPSSYRQHYRPQQQQPYYP